MRRLTILAAVAVGLLAGLGAFTFVYAKGGSYMTNDPTACANCHIMEDHYAAWLKSSHRAVAVCNDCHAPHGLVAKYIVKAENGWRHSVAFTTGNHPDPMRITPRNNRVTEQACKDCHENIVAALTGRGPGGVPEPAAAPSASTPASSRHSPAPGAASGEPVSCIHCHRTVGHWVR